MLAATTGSHTPEIAIQLWDLRYSVILASHLAPLPSTFAENKHSTPRLTLEEATSSQAILVLDAIDVKTDQTPSPSSVMIVPFSCPISSTIANALGLAAASAIWIESSANSGTLPKPKYGTSETKVVSAMQAAMEKNSPQAANKAFFEWEKRESKITVGSLLFSLFHASHDL
jgi:hypothetical protein